MDITGFKSKDGTVHKYDYNALANKPVIPEGSGGSADKADIEEAVVKYLTENPVEGGMTRTEKDLILNLFRNAAYTSANLGAELTQLETIWSGGEAEPDIPEEPDVPVTPEEPESGVSNETVWTNGVAYTFEPIANSYPDKSTGVIKDYAKWERSPYLYCAGASTLRGVVRWQSALFSGTNDNAFYDADKKYIAPVGGAGTFNFKALVNAEAGTYADIPIPENAAYFIVSGGNNLLSGNNNSNNESYIGYVPYA